MALVLGIAVAALLLTLMAQRQPHPVPESLITKVSRIADSYGPWAGYEIRSWTDDEAWASIYLEAENGRIPFENIYFQKADDEWLEKERSHWPVPSPSLELTILDYEIHTTTVSNHEFSNILCLNYLIPLVRNSSRWPSFVASVELKLENSTDRYWKSYSTVGRSIEGIVGPWETSWVGFGGGPALEVDWYQQDNLLPVTKLLPLDRLEGKTFDITITLKDGEGTILAENTFTHTF